MAYSAITETMDERDFRAFDVELHADDPQGVSHGTRQLMAVMGMPPKPPPRPKGPE